jgi:hypothetical protein
MNIDELFEAMWGKYSSLTPDALKIKNIFEKLNDSPVNDHVAFRTINDTRVNIDKVSEYLLELGYVEGGEYNFDEKKLYAKHFYIPNSDAPKVFISELLLEEFSPFLQDVINDCVSKVNFNNPIDFLLGGRVWDINYNTYRKLVEESEYAAWYYLYGYVANHFTIDVNKSKKFTRLRNLNEFLESEGYELNSSGGLIKGGKDVYLEQSSTMANKVTLKFNDGEYKVPSCFYEFAYRYPMGNGELFQGFVASSANKIFESTNLN